MKIENTLPWIFFVVGIICLIIGIFLAIESYEEDKEVKCFDGFETVY